MSEFEERSRAHSRAQTDAMMVYIEAERRVKELKAENEKLRKLACNLWDVALHPQTFGDGSYLRGELEKLGIEVD